MRVTASATTCSTSCCSSASRCPSSGCSRCPGRAATAPLRPVLLVALLTFLATSLLFPVATTWGTFLHAVDARSRAAADLSALGALDAGIAALGRRLGWTRPVAWLGPRWRSSPRAVLGRAAAGLRRQRAATARTYQVLAAQMAAIGAPLDGSAPVIHDFPIWLAETERVSTPRAARRDARRRARPRHPLRREVAHRRQAEPRLRGPRSSTARTPMRLLPGGPAADPRRPGRCRGHQGHPRVPDLLLRRRAHAGDCRRPHRASARLSQ